MTRQSKTCATSPVNNPAYSSQKGNSEIQASTDTLDGAADGSTVNLRYEFEIEINIQHL